MSDPTITQRNRRYRAKLRHERGWARVEVFVPADRADELRLFARRLREESRGTRAQENQEAVNDRAKLLSLNDRLLLRTLNTSLVPIGLDQLLACLEGTSPPEPWREHLAVFSQEIPRDLAYRFILEHALDPAVILAELSRLAHEDRNAEFEAWLGELARAAA